MNQVDRTEQSGESVNNAKKPTLTKNTILTIVGAVVFLLVVTFVGFHLKRVGEKAANTGTSITQQDTKTDSAISPVEKPAAEVPKKKTEEEEAEELFDRIFFMAPVEGAARNSDGRLKWQVSSILENETYKRSHGKLKEDQFISDILSNQASKKFAYAFYMEEGSRLFLQDWKAEELDAGVEMYSGQINFPSLSADGNRAVFIATMDGNETIDGVREGISKLMILNLETMQVEHSLDIPNSARYPQFSHDGTCVLYAAEAGFGNTKIFRVNAKDKDLLPVHEEICDIDGRYSKFLVSPVENGKLFKLGKQQIFTSTGFSTVFEMTVIDFSLSTSSPKSTTIQATGFSEYDSFTPVAWSSDGKSVYLIKTDDRAYDLVRANFETMQLEPMFHLYSINMD